MCISRIKKQIDIIDIFDILQFYSIDCCGNFEFLRMNNGKPTALQMALQGVIFSLKAQIANIAEH